MATIEKGRRLAIADIHGCKATFKKLLKKIDLQFSDNLYILGDMIDRGPSSSGVLDTIINYKEKGYNIFPIRGNHEQMLLEAVKMSPEKIHSYLRYFRSADLLSRKGNIKKRYFELIQSLPFYIELEDYILVHASVDLSKKNYLEETDFMLYSKYHRGNTVNLNEKRLIHGHIVLSLKTIIKSIEEQSKIIGIDNGCIYGNKQKDFGKLLCLNLDTMELITKTFCD